MLLLARVEWIQSERSTSRRKPTLVGQWGPQTLPNALSLTKQSSEDCSTQQEGISLYKAPALILYHYKTIYLPNDFLKKRMIRTNCKSLLQNCKSLEELKQIHAHVITQGLQNLQPLSCKILNFYAKLNEPTYAHLVFSQIQNPDIVSWTSLISLHLQTNHPHVVISIFSQIISMGMKPDSFAIVGALAASGRNEDLGHGRLLHGMIFRHEMCYDTTVNNALIDMYCRNGKIETARVIFSKMIARDVVSWTSMLHGHIKCMDLESAFRVFEEMPERNAIAWTAMITGCVQGRSPLRALQLFCEMKLVGEEPTVVTIVGVLSACADVGALDLGRSVHGYVNKTDMNSDMTVYNALMDMYSKSGSIETAERIFGMMSEKDSYSWTTIISAFATHGNGIRAIQAFLEMLRLGLCPNEVTFVAVLSACCHSGLIDEGQKWFQRMTEFYGFKPNILHYGCMVDLFGRAGLLKEAENLVAGMQIEPDAVIWRSLLSACLVHGNLELAKLVGNKIIELEPEDDVVYILLWNMHAAANRWKEALEMRTMMKDRRIKKKPGSSWIEVKGVVHEFFVEDKTHHVRKEIYLVLEGIAKHLKPD